MRQLSKIPTQSIYYLIMCSAGVLLFIAIGLYPMHSSLGRQEEDMAKVKVQIEEQKALFPLYKELLLLGKVPRKDSRLLPVSKKTGLSLDQLGNISIIFTTLAQGSSLEAISVTPDVKSLSNNSKTISVLLVLRGDFLMLRGFLFELERLPYLEHIEEIQIQEAAEGKEFRLKTWLAVNTEKSK